jgi:hypothetical protein
VAITTLDGLTAAIAGSQDITIQKASMTSVATFWSSLWAEAGNPAAGTLTIGNTSNGLVPDDTTAGAPLISAFSGANTGYLGSIGVTSAVSGVYVLYDRLFHVGSISFASAATTTLSSQPSFSARVPGSNWGECEIWVEVNVVHPGSASTTVTVSYQDGTGAGGATQTANQMYGSNFSAYPTKRMVPFALANNTGVQKINSVTVATPAASGSFNVVVLRRLAQLMVPVAALAEPRQDFFKTGGQIVFANSCLATMMLATGIASGPMFMDAQIING